MKFVCTLDEYGKIRVKSQNVHGTKNVTYFLNQENIYVMALQYLALN